MLHWLWIAVKVLALLVIAYALIEFVPGPSQWHRFSLKKEKRETQR